VNAPLVSLQSKNTNNANSEVRFKQLMRDLQSVVRSQSALQRIHLNKHPTKINIFLCKISSVYIKNQTEKFMGYGFVIFSTKNIKIKRVLFIIKFRVNSD
jgi:hypothetical protein